MMKWLLLCGILAAVAGEPLSNDEDGKREKEKRELTFKNDKRKIEMKAENKIGKFKDKLEFQIEGRNKGLETRFRYKMDDKERKVDIGFRVKAYRVIEYKDVGEQGNGYQKGVDTEIKSVDIGGKDKWGDFVASEEKNAAGDIVQVFSVTTVEAASAEGTFGAVGRYSAVPVTIVNNSVTYNLSPSSVKFDFLVKDWVYAAEGTSLAIEGRFKSKSKLKVKGDGKLVAEEGEAAPKFDWVSTVMADDKAIPVIASPVKPVTAADGEDPDKDLGESDNKMYFSFITTSRVKTFNWDPEVGVAFHSPTSASSRLSLSWLTYLCLFSAFVAPAFTLFNDQVQPQL
jgi:hypothetical protein